MSPVVTGNLFRPPTLLRYGTSLLPRRLSTLPGFQSLLEMVERDKKKKRRSNDIEDEDEEMGKCTISELGIKLEKLNGGGTEQQVGEELGGSSRGSGIDWSSFDLEETLKKHDRMLLDGLALAGDADEFCRWMSRIDRFEEKNFRLPFGGSAVQEMVNNFRVATGDQRADLLRRIDRAFRVVQCQDAHDPKKATGRKENVKDDSDDSPSSQSHDIFRSTARRRKQKKQPVKSAFMMDGEQYEEFHEMKGDDDLLLGKLVDIEKKVKEKHRALGNRDGSSHELSGERDTVQEQRRVPPCRGLKGFDVKFVDVYSKRDARKGGESVRYIVCLACGNYDGVVGFAQAKDPELRVAIWKSYDECFQNLYFLERHVERTIAKPLDSEYDGTKIFLWPAPKGKGMKGSRIVETILILAGFKDMRSKVIGWVNPQNTVMALLRALNAVKITEDVSLESGSCRRSGTSHVRK